MIKRQPVLLLGGNGSRSGFASARAEGKFLELTVLPKMWRPAGSASRRGKASDDSDDDEDAERPASFWDASAPGVFYEGDRVALPEGYEDVAHILAAGADAAEKRFAREKGAPRRPSPLVSVTFRVAQHSTPSAPPTLAHSSGRADEAALCLALLAHRADDRELGLTATASTSQEGVTSLCKRAETDSEVRRLLRAFEFVQLVRSRIREIRQGYIEVHDSLSCPRGRIESKGIVRHLATEEPQLACVFDEFTPALPLYHVIVTALECLGAGESTWGSLARSALATRVKIEAMQTRAALGSIPGRPVPEAAMIARGLRLTGLWRRWEPVRRLALAVLERQPPGLQEGAGDDGGAIVWVVNTARLWERLVEESLAKLVGRRGTVYFKGQQRGRPGNPLICPSPWAGVGEKKDPDLFLVTESSAWVLDAKYKAIDDLTQLASGDQYQLFSYSLLSTTGNGLPTHTAVVRPITYAPGGRSYPRNYANPAGAAVQITDIALPFPQREAPLDAESWDRAMGALQAGWPAL